MSIAPPLRATPKQPHNYVLTQPYHKGPIAGLPNPHLALDLVGYLGQPVYAAESGRVSHSSWDGDGLAIGGGNVVMLDHTGPEGRRYRSLYAHLRSRAVVKLQYVVRGQLIGYADTTGKATGSHVHFAFGVYNSAPGDGGFTYVDPYTYIHAHGFANGSVGDGPNVAWPKSSLWVGEGGATNLRASSTTSSAILATARSRTLVAHLGSVDGQAWPGPSSSRRWDRIFIASVGGRWIGKLGYVHGSLGSWVL